MTKTLPDSTSDKSSEKLVTELDCYMLLTGVGYGNTIAKIVIKQFPDGFTDQIADEIASVTTKALSTALAVYTQGGVANRHREEFENGFRIGLRNSFGEYAAECGARALKDTTIG